MDHSVLAIVQEIITTKSKQGIDYENCFQTILLIFYTNKEMNSKNHD